MALKRTPTLTILAILLLGMAVAAFEYARRIVFDPSPLVQRGVAPHGVIEAAVVGGVAAASAALAAWFRHAWLPWGVTLCGLSGAAMLYVFQKGAGPTGEPVWMVLFPYAVIVLATVLVARYASGKL
jgi:hypothetical protein